MTVALRRVLAGILLVAMALFADISRAANSQPDTYYLFVFSNPAAGKEAEFEKWYAEQHAPDVTSVPGFVSAQRFQLAARQLRPGSPALPGHLVLYKIVTSDLAKVYAEVNRRATSGETRMSNTVDVKSFVNRTYRVIRPALSGNDKRTGLAASNPRQLYGHFVFGEAKPDQDQAFNDWYDQYHAPEILAVPGFVWGQRMQWNEVQLNNGASGSRYLMMFRIETGDLGATLDAFGSVAPKMTMNSSFDGTRTFGYTYQAIGPELDGDKVRAARSGK